MGIYRLRRKSKDAFLRATDHGNIGYIGTDLYAANGTDNSVVYNTLYKSTDRGATWVEQTAPAWSARNGCAWISDGTTIKQFGGTDYSGSKNDSWSFDGTTATQISASMTGFGSRSSFGYGFKDGFYYAIAGNLGGGTVIKSADLITWTFVSNVPAELANAPSITACIWNGIWYIVPGYDGTEVGVPSGKLWRSTDNLLTFESILTNTIFDGIWSDIAATDNALFFVRGHVQPSGGNQKGCYYCEGDPANIANWKRAIYEMTASHATPLCEAFGNIYSFCGNMFNASWEFEQIDKV